jgi:ribosome production factor 1
MPGSSKAPRTSSIEGGNFKHIGNKHKRQDLYKEHRKNKAQEKLKKRIARAKDERGEEGAEKKRVSEKEVVVFLALAWS